MSEHGYGLTNQSDASGALNVAERDPSRHYTPIPPQIPPLPADSKWTEEQWQAITARGTDILVAAAAGSGKTAVLVERIVRMIAVEQLSIDQLLVVTFTNAAAAEMRQRVGDALQKRLMTEGENAHLRRQLSLLNRAQISTLHAFCMRLLRQHYYLVELDPNFRMLDDTEARLMREEVLDELIEDAYAQESEAFYELVDRFSSDRNDDAVHNMIQRLLDFSRSQPWPDEWLATLVKQYEGSDASVNRLLDVLLADIQRQLEEAAMRILEAEAFCQEPGGPLPYADNLVEDALLVRHLQEAAQRSWSALHDACQGVQFSRLKRCNKEEVDPDIQERVKQLRNEAKDIIADMQRTFFGRDVEAYVSEMQEMVPVLQTLVQLINEFDSRYRAVKRKKGVLDFADLEQETLRILQHEQSAPGELLPSAVAQQYAKQFAEILVDEYQDTNMIQESILQVISRSRQTPTPIFMVGDVKQSIYRFRLAEPALFMDKYRRFPKLAKGVQAHTDYVAGWRIDLSRNFRSRPAVIHGTNFIFRQLMSETVGEMAYDEDAALVYGANYPPSGAEHAVELTLLDRSASVDAIAEQNEEATGQKKGTEEQRDQAGSAQLSTGQTESAQIDVAQAEAAQLEANEIVQRIRSMVGYEQSDGESAPFFVYDRDMDDMRSVRYRDIVILLRSTSNWASVILDALKQHGIPAYAELGSGYFEATEVSNMISLLHVIDNPYQDIPLAAVLRSPIVGLTATQLAQIRIIQPNGSYYKALQHILQNDHASGNDGMDEEDINKINQFHEQLNQWRHAARQGSLSALIWRIYRETGYYDFVGALPGGNQRQANLRALYDRARQYEKTAFRGLFRFLRFVERMRDQGNDLGTARALGEQEDVVRVMTIHKSKGLEFPIVFVPGLAKQFNFSDVRARYVLHAQLGFGCAWVDVQKRMRYPMLPQLAIKQRMKMEQLAEEMRILYVAMTRAREKLILSATVTDGAHVYESWQKHAEHSDWVLADADRAKAKSYLDWLAPALIRHRNGIQSPDSPDSEDCLDDRNDIHPNENDPNVVNRLVRSDTPGRSETSTAIWQDPSQWHCCWKVAQLHPEEKTDGPDRDDVWAALGRGEALPFESDWRDDVRHRLNWKYPYAHATRFRAKQSVTEIKRQRDMNEEHGDSTFVRALQYHPLTARPRFMQTESVSAAEKGTIMHTVMQHIPLDQSVNMDTYMDTLVAREILPAPHVKEVDIAAVQTFLQSPLAKRMRQANWVEREVPFSLALPPDVAYAAWAEEADSVKELVHSLVDGPERDQQQEQDERVLIQGVVDVLFEDAHGLVLLDYKTDAIQGRFTDTETALAQLRQRYGMQIMFYAQAVEHIWKKRVTEKYVYVFDGGHLIHMIDE